MAAVGAAARPDRIRLRSVLSNPAWPVYVLFLGLPIWWVLGIRHFMWPVVATFMGLSLLIRRGVRIPVSAAIWALLLSWMLVSALALDNSGRIFGFALRFSFYASAGIFLLYLYNSQRISSRAIVSALAGCWVLVVVGGYLGVLFPKVAFHTPMERILPGSLLANGYIHDMTYARFSEVQTFLGFDVGRPATFFTYTNGWGSGFALLVPFALAEMALTGSRRWRRLLGVTVVLSIVPVIVSLNRGLWICLVVAAVYTVGRFIGEGNAGGAVRLLALVGALVLTIALSPLGGLFQDRLAHGHSNGAREALYRETFARVKNSPLIGYGAPRPAEGSSYLDSAGTQGQVLYLVFSHGYPGLILFFAWLGHAFFRSARLSSPAGLAGQATLLIAAVQAPFYGLLTQVFVIAAAAAVTLKEAPVASPRVVSSTRPLALRSSEHPLEAW
jgi:polysaccharide biosynthesis protein PslJ